MFAQINDADQIRFRASFSVNLLDDSARSGLLIRLLIRLLSWLPLARRLADSQLAFVTSLI